jgi:hypothetical protein
MQWAAAFAAFLLLLAASPAHASLLEGDALDTMANVIAWIAIIIVPLVLLAVFWWLHIMPEKIAEQRHHPQLGAIKVLCLLSLIFGGMLWPIAWVWAYTKPVLYQLAYGTDKVKHGEPEQEQDDALHLYEDDLVPDRSAAQASVAPMAESEDVASLRRRVASLEMQLAAASAQAAGRTPRDDGSAGA